MLDLNVILDVILARDPWRSEAEAIWDANRDGRLGAYIFAAALPTMLLQAKYSREFEAEADEFALDYLAKKGIPPDAFSSLLERLERGGVKDCH